MRRDLALSESGVAGIGLACILAGFVGTGVPGVTRLLVALVAAQLCFFGGVVRWLGVIGVVIVVAGVAYSLR